MKKPLLALTLVGLVAAGAFGGSSSIRLTAPHVTSWTQTVNGQTLVASASDLQSLNDGLVLAFQTIEDDLNTNTFGKLHDLTLLPKGFANASSAAFDNASLLGYQTYDLFAVMLGFDLGLVVPSVAPSGSGQALNDVATTGDLEAGVSTGGLALQVGANLGQFVPKLYGTAKFGFVPSMNVNGASFQQVLFGLGVNYTLVPQYDFFYGLFKWRGVSAGTGFTYNGSSANVDIAVADQVASAFTAPIGTSSVRVTPVASGNKARLTVNTSSLVIPFDVMSSVQVFWFLNLGLDLGLDVAFSGARVKLAGDSNLVLQGISGASMTPGSAQVTATDSQGGGDLFLPRIGTSLGLDLAIFKLDVPMSYYPLSRAFSIGLTGGLVW